MQTLVISFYSDVDGRTYYSDHARRLSENLKQFNIPHDIRHMPSKGSYRANCLAKPRYILERLNEYRKPLVWLDVDSIVHKELNVFDEFWDQVDIGMAFAKTPTQEDPSISFPKASPIYVNYNEKGLEFMYKWIEASEQILRQSEIFFDHEILVKLFESMLKENTGTRLAFLNQQYCVWPGVNIGQEPIITMGLADGQSKEESLAKMGYDKQAIEYQSPGNKFLMSNK
jgi:hypothetical protein